MGISPRSFMSLVNELQISAEKDDVISALRKAKRLYHKLNLDRPWIDAELSGYTNQPIPPYRYISIRLAYFTDEERGWLPVEKAEKLNLSRRPVGESISTVMQWIAGLPNSNGVHESFKSDLNEIVKNGLNIRDDGDGCLCVSGRGARWTLCGTKHFLTGVSHILSLDGFHSSITPTGKISMLSVSGNSQIANLLDRLYDGASQWMSRKYNKKIEFNALRDTIRPIRLRTKISDQEATKIAEAYTLGDRICDIEKRFNITNRTMYKILKKREVPNRTSET